MTIPDLRQLRQFVAVAEHLHFGRAAEALHISQPPLSRSIQDLEAKLGARLFERSRRKVELTAAGAWYLEEARQVIARLERASRSVAELAAGGAGTLRIGFVTIADYSVLPGLLTRFKAANPGGDTLTPAQFKTFIDLNAAQGIGRAAQIKSHDAYDRAFKTVDANKDGTVSWDEYLKAQ